MAAHLKLYKIMLHFQGRSQAAGLGAQLGLRLAQSSLTQSGLKIDRISEEAIEVFRPIKSYAPVYSKGFGRLALIYEFEP